jgi:hypothetical protein
MEAERPRAELIVSSPVKAAAYEQYIGGVNVQ